VKDQIKVNLGENSYSVIWQDLILSLKKDIEKFTEGRKTAVITNTKIYGIYKKEINNLFKNSLLIILPDGEKTKRIKTIEEISEKLLKENFNRDSLLIAFGGGVIGDITGFAASIYARGISFVQVPTTLLAMVDSSVGGKTGVNLSQGKNMAGTFYQPKAVFICCEFLKTLPKREINCGLAEAVKSALIMNKVFFSFLEKNVENILNKNINIMNLLSKESVLVKAAVVEKDEKENLLRGILNLGHTLAHAIESWYNYKYINHGEAVSIGLSFAAFFSYRQGILEEKKYHRIIDILTNLKLNKNISNLPGQKKPKAEELLELMKKDKKNKKEEIYFVMLKDIGQYLLPKPVESKKLFLALKEFYKL